MTLKNPLLYQKQSNELLQAIQAGLVDRLKAQGWQDQVTGLGAALTRLFGRMAEVMIYRLNQAPEQHFRTFLNAAEIDRLAPRPARTELTFAPAADGALSIRVPAGTQVNTRPTPMQPEVIFETERDVTVIPTVLTACIAVDPVNYSNQTAKAVGTAAGAFAAFAGDTERVRIFYIDGDQMLRFSDASSRAHATVTLTFAFDRTKEADQTKAGTDDWRLAWLYWNGADPSQPRWAKLQEAGTLITDTTDNFRKDGAVAFSRLPELTMSVINGEQGVWLGCQLTGGTSRHYLPTIKRITISRVIVDDPMFALFEVTRQAQTPVTLTFAFVPPEVAAVPWVVHWLYWTGKQWARLQDAGVQIVDTTEDFRKDGVVTFNQLPELNTTEVNGEAGAWLACKLSGAGSQPLPIFKAVAGGRVCRASEEVKPDAAFAMIQGGSAFVPLNMNSTCAPLGQQPALLDSFFLRVDEAFTKAGATITLKLDLQELPSALEDTSELEKLEIEWAYSSLGGWTVLGTTKRGCPALEKLNFESLDNPNSGAALFGKPTLQTTPLIGGKYLEFIVPSAYRDVPVEQLPAPFAQGKLVTDIYTGAKYVQIPIPKECENLPTELLINGCSTAKRLHFKDKTCALTSKGLIQFTVPSDDDDNPQFANDPAFVPAQVNEQAGYWLRARIINGSYNVPQKAQQNVTARLLMATPQFLPPLVYAPVLQKLQIFYRDYQQREPSKPPPTFVIRGHSKTDERWQNHAHALATRQSFAPYRAAVEEPALYLGFTPLPASTPRVAFPLDQWIQLRIDVDESGSRQTGRLAVAWEYWNGAGWRPLRVADGTLGLSRQEYLGFFAPADHGPSTEFGVSAYWLRIRPLAGAPADMPFLQTLRLNTVPAVNAETIRDEILGSSDGKPHQTFQLARSPALPDIQIQVLEPDSSAAEGNTVGTDGVLPAGLHTSLITTNGTAPMSGNGTNGTALLTLSAAATGFEKWVTWQCVASFHFAGPESRCYRFDAISGEIRFGDGKHGKLPPVGNNNIRALTYRVHNGLAGNVAPTTITVMRNPSGVLGGIQSVTNREDAAGGLNAQPIEETESRGPQRLKHRERSVTLEDFRWLTLEANYVARAYCLPARDRNGMRQPGWVGMVIVPQSAGQGPTAKKPAPTPALLRQVHARLEEMALVNLRPFVETDNDDSTAHQVNTVDQIYVKGPTYVEVAVEAWVVPSKPEQADTVKVEILQRLEQFLHPLTGGPAQTGWELGRDVYLSEVAAEIESVPGVDYAAAIRLQATSMQQQCLQLATAFVAPLALPAGSQVSTFDERIKVILAQSLAKDEQTEQLNVYGFNSGEAVQIVAEDSMVLADNQVIDKLDDNGRQILLAAPTPDPTRWQQPAFAVMAMNGRVRLEIDQCLFAYDAKGRPRLMGFGLHSFDQGERISVVCYERPRQRVDFLTVEDVLPGVGLTRIFVPEDQIVCSGVHQIHMEVSAQQNALAPLPTVRIISGNGQGGPANHLRRRSLPVRG